jgi:hypothetical protein
MRIYGFSFESLASTGLFIPIRWTVDEAGSDLFLQERLTRGTVTSTMRMATHSSERARCGAGAGCATINYQSL